MASWEKRKFGSSQELEEYLNGALISSLNLHDGAYMDGQTFVFEVDGGGDTTVTFTAKGRKWTLQEIIDQINASEADLAHIRTEVRPGANKPIRRLKLQKALTSFVIKNTGTGNDELGFPTGSNTPAVYVAPADLEFIKQVPGEQDSWLVWRYA